MKNLKYTKKTHPWPHIIIDDFLPQSDLQRIENVLKQDHPFKIQPEDPEEIQYIALPDTSLVRDLLSEEFKLFLEDLCGTRLKIFEQGALQLRRMTPESPEFPAHIDFIDKRALIMLLYLSPDWSPTNGGELILQKAEEFQAETDLLISPLQNRMILFFNDTHHWHSVRKVHNWTRYLVMAEWIVQ